MRSVFLFLLIVIISSSSLVLAQENICSDEISQLKILNADLKQKLEIASSEISKLKLKNTEQNISNNILFELEKTKKDLKNQTDEVRMLREKLMISKDDVFNGD